MTQYINHSGGCPGADMKWENEGNKYGVKTIAYSFHNHVQDSPNQKILTVKELAEGFEHIEIANKTLKKNIDNLPPYVRNLLARNWFQVKNSEAVYPIGIFEDNSTTLISGGTGWSAQLAIDNKKPVYFFDQTSGCWYEYNYSTKQFDKMNEIPTLTENFAGIGTRELIQEGGVAIELMLQYNLDREAYERSKRATVSGIYSK